MNEVEFQSVSLLLSKAKSGCDKSRTELIDQLQSYMQLMAERHAGNQLQEKLGASDIVQQSVVNVLQGFDGFRGSSRGEFKAWLKQILINEIRKSQKSYQREKRDVSRERSIDNSRNGVRGSLTDREPTPGANAIEQEQLALMRAAIARLPPDYGQVIRLRSLERLSFKDVARQMSRSADATTKLWYRAILRLEQQMKRENEIDT